MSNGARIKGPCILGKNTEVYDFTIQDYAIIENSYIGAGCVIGSHAVILDSTLVKNITVYPHATIEKSIIMEQSKVYYHAEVLHSIVGKEAIVGSGVKTPCQRLKKMREEPAYVTYFTDIGIKKTEKFGAIIGDYCQIGSGTVIHPGRRIGKQSNIYANCEILRNVKPSSNIRNKDIVEGYD
jgi:glucose-1-phosphate thymidylyltransferase